MRTGLILVLLALAATVGAAEPRNVAPRHTLDTTAIEVRIRVETFGRLSTSSLARMRDEVERIWSAAGVHLVWLDARIPLVHQAPELEPAVHVTILVEDQAHWSGATSSPEALAQATLYHPPGGMPTAVVITAIDRARLLITDMIRRNGERPVLLEYLVPVMLGRAAAHEVGHYLLGPRHSARGLMRAALGPADAMLMVPRSLLALDPAEVQDLRSRWIEVRRPALLADRSQ
jgi:hypothetical protein